MSTEVTLTVRPELPQQLEDRIETIYRQAGYQSKGDLVRDAVRKHVNELEAEHHVQEVAVRDAFDYSIHRTRVSGPEIRFTPKREAPVRFKYVDKGNPPHTTLLDTGTTYVAEDDIVDALENIEGVERAGVLTKGEIKVTVAEDNPVPLAESDTQKPLVDRVYDTLDPIIREANQRVLDGEETRRDAFERAVKPYWPMVTNRQSIQ